MSRHLAHRVDLDRPVAARPARLPRVFDFSSFPTLTTERVILRELQSSDAADVLVFRSDAEAQRFNSEPLLTLEQSTGLIDELLDAYAAQCAVPWAVTLRASGRVVGLCRLQLLGSPSPTGRDRLRPGSRRLGPGTRHGVAGCRCAVRFRSDAAQPDRGPDDRGQRALRTTTRSARVRARGIATTTLLGGRRHLPRRGDLRPAQRPVIPVDISRCLTSPQATSRPNRR